MTRTWLILTVLTVVTAGLGCCNTAGIRDARSKPRPDDPRYTIEEQRRRARDKFAFPDDDFRAGPRSGSELPGGIGR
jgi:hypothetical protein